MDSSEFSHETVAATDKEEGKKAGSKEDGTQVLLVFLFLSSDKSEQKYKDLW